MDRPQMAGICFAIASAVLGAIGLLQSKPLPLSARLGEMAPIDANNDGRISASEWKSAGRAVPALNALDSDHDGYLEPGEVKRRRGAGARH